MAVDLVPWVVPPDYAKIMQAGTSAGLEARSIASREAEARRRDDVSQEIAADRLRLAYDQIASQERRAAETVQAKREQSQAALQLRALQSRDLNAYRQGQLEARAQSEERQAANMLRLAEQFRERENRIAEQFGASQQGMFDRATMAEEGKQGRFEASQESTQGRFETREERLNRERRESAASALDREERGANRAVARMELNTTLRELEDVKKDMAKIEAEGGPSRGMFGLTAGTTKAYEALQAKKQEAENRIETLKREGSSMATTGGSLMRRISTKEERDALPPGAAYIWTDGNTYIKQR